jgi:hypothetical protein
MAEPFAASDVGLYLCRSPQQCTTCSSLRGYQRFFGNVHATSHFVGYEKNIQQDHTFESTLIGLRLTIQLYVFHGAYVDVARGIPMQ